MPPSTIRRPGVAFIHFTRVCYPRTSTIPMHPLGLAASGAPFGRRARVYGKNEKERKGTCGGKERRKVAAFDDQRSFGTLASGYEFTHCAPRKLTRANDGPVPSCRPYSLPARIVMFNSSSAQGFVRRIACVSQIYVRVLGAIIISICCEMILHK